MPSSTLQFYDATPGDDLALPVDFVPLIKEAVNHAERGFWDLKLKTPAGRRMTVRQIVRRYNLTRLLSADAREGA